MNKKKLIAVAADTTRRHPRGALKVGGFAVEHRKGVMRTVRTAIKARRRYERTLAKATQPAVRREAGAAISILGDAFARARKLGPKKAVEDKKLAGLVRQVGQHSGNAMRLARKPPKRANRLRTVLVGSLLAGGAFAEWRRRAASPDERTV